MHSCVRMIYHLKPVSKRDSGVVLFNLKKCYHTVSRVFCHVQGTKDISYEELKALVGKSPNLILIDVRSEEEVAKGHIPGCTNIPREIVFQVLYVFSKFSFASSCFLPLSLL